MKKRVLVVECVLQEHEWLVRNLNKADYHVVACCDGDWAFAFLRTHLCDVVVVGRAMGSRLRTEEEFIEAIREIDPGQPIVVLEKPYNARRLLKWVEAARWKLLPLFDAY
jgi:DNA-binding response OmpR family regulator